MNIKALEKYHEFELASNLSIDLLSAMIRCYREYSPHTIWECYSPTKTKPASSAVKPLCRPDFCGWSALNPISLLIENIIGIHTLSAKSQLIEWIPGISGRIGVRNLKLGDNRIDLVSDNGIVTVNCDKPVTIRLKGQELVCSAGKSTHSSSISP